jgi:hypothetical protein
MALPELTRELLEAKLTAYCERRVPLHARDQLRVTFTVHGNHVTIKEERIAFRQAGTWVTMPIAKLRLDEASGEWSLYCADRNDRWHHYRYAKPAKDIAALLDAIDNDKTGAFWG